MTLTQNELMTVKGGITKWGIIGIAAAAITIFGIGFIDGFTRTLKCNNKK